MVELNAIDKAMPKAGALFYFLVNLAIDIVLMPFIYNNMISAFYTGSTHLLYSVLLFAFIITKTGVVTLLIATGGQKKAIIKTAAITWFMINLIIDWIIIELIYGWFIPTFFASTRDQLILTAFMFLFIMAKTGLVSILLLVKDEPRG